ncbi:hypothetical protein [Spongiimicrobium sp. 2-473A-2-J]|uniref:hypothetical protein n=1 Tax=Eudoraea algarum TaxID=3417568 RepID=UPI003D35C270
MHFAIKKIIGKQNGLNICLATMLLMLGCAEQPEPWFTEADRREIERSAKELPLVLAQEGWAPYEAHFAKHYKNWPMMRDATRSREEFLSLVKTWYEAGNRATASETETIDFIPIAKDMVLYLRSQKEAFNDPKDSTITVVRDMRNVSIHIKEDGRWKSLFTAFMDIPEKE